MKMKEDQFSNKYLFRDKCILSSKEITFYGGNQINENKRR